MKKLITSIYLIFTFFCTEALSNDDKTYVSFDVIEMNVERVNDNLFRWIKFHPDSEFPCLRLEILEAGSVVMRLSSERIFVTCMTKH